MEEYMYEYLRRNEIRSNWVYLPIFWTNLQNHPGFSSKKANYQILLNRALENMASDTTYFTIVQHDDGPQLHVPNLIVFGACTGTIPLPLIYEDTSQRLLSSPRLPKDLLASFVGTYTTHSIRQKMLTEMRTKTDIHFHAKSAWEVKVAPSDSDAFVEITSRSKFCLAPRGYGRSSFRFVEALQLGVVPVYLWDDIEWLPYKETLDYSKFSVSVSSHQIPQLYEFLSSISDQKYQEMVEEGKKVHHWFTLEGMAQYVVSRLS
jgi:Exostosin family